MSMCKYYVEGPANKVDAWMKRNGFRAAQETRTIFDPSSKEKKVVVELQKFDKMDVPFLSRNVTSNGQKIGTWRCVDDGGSRSLAVLITPVFEEE